MSVLPLRKAVTVNTGTDNAQPTVLHIDGASKVFPLGGGREAVALEPVNTTIQRGEFVSLVGPSGCGKSTLLRICANLVSPSTGETRFMDSGKPMQPGAYGFVFQAPSLLPWRTVLENVLLPADILRRHNSGTKDRAMMLLDLVKLSDSVNKYPHELSGGMQQRASIARALLHDPEILLMDEPFGALDAMTREELNAELQRIHLDQKKTVVFVTHDIDEAVLLSDRVLVMNRRPGRIAKEVTVSLPRPRDVADRLSPEFLKIAVNVREILDGKSV